MVGLFAGWVRDPAAVLTTFRHGEGHVIATTLRVAPEDGPVATALLESLVRRASRLAAGRDAGSGAMPARLAGGTPR